MAHLDIQRRSLPDRLRYLADQLEVAGENEREAIALMLRQTANEMGPERAGREGDSQPLPIINESAFIHDLVKDDLESRKQLGKVRYGTPLQAHNGRNALRDAYEEALDLAVYLKQALIEAGDAT